MTDFATIPDEDIQEYEALFISTYRELYPDYDWAHGSLLYEMVIRPAAIRAAADEGDIEALRNNMSLYLASIQDEPDQELVLALASNFRVTTEEGIYGAGDLAVYVGQSVNVYIRAGTIFNAGGLTVTCEKTYAGVTDDSDYTDTDDTVYRQLTKVGSEWAFLVPVRTVEYTDESVSQGVQVSTETRPAQVKRIETASSIGGGRSPDSTEEILEQAQTGMTAKVPSGNAHLEALLAKNTTVNVQSQASFGINDPECIRDRDNVFGISTGGRVDAWCRTAVQPSSRTVTISATRTTSTALWQMFIQAAVGLGFYRITSIKHADSASIISGESDLIVAYGHSGVEGGPHVFSADTARYSVYQTANVQFAFNEITDTDTEFEVTLEAMPGLESLQDYLNRRDVRNEAHDVLVRAPNPASVSITMIVERPTGDTLTTAADLQAVVANAVNATDIGIDGLDASLLVNAVEGHDPALHVAFPISMQADFQQPDGSTKTVRSLNGRVEVPESDSSWVTERNTMYYCVADTVKVELKDVDQ